jgi:hypothetical protein
MDNPWLQLNPNDFSTQWWLCSDIKFKVKLCRFSVDKNQIEFCKILECKKCKDLILVHYIIYYNLLFT